MAKLQPINQLHRFEYKISFQLNMSELNCCFAEKSQNNPESGKLSWNNKSSCSRFKGFRCEHSYSLVYANIKETVQIELNS